MPHRILPIAWAFSLAATLTPAHAQQQTAASAQRFLGMLASDGALSVQALDKATGAMSLQGTETSVDRWLKDGVQQNDGPYGGGRTKASTKSLQKLLDVLKAEGVDQRGNIDPCTTRLETSTKEKLDYTYASNGTAMKETLFGYDELPYRGTTTGKYEDPNVKYAGPYYVVWSKALINRTVGWINVSAQDSRFTSSLHFKITDQEMGDRVEFAMKFLKASCDKTASTGF